jgi:hypothetical protein
MAHYGFIQAHKENNMKIIEKEFNVLTGEETITEREETTQEVVEREAAEAELVALQAKAETKATAKAALLTQLGITEEQAKLLLS